MKGTIWGIAVLAIVLGLLLPAANAGFENAQAPRDVEGESIIVDYDSPSRVDVDADAFGETVNITADGDVLTAGTSYTWDASTGEVTWLSSNETTDGETAYIDYSFTGGNQAGNDSNTVLTGVGSVLGLLMFLVAIGALISLLGSGGGF